MVRGQLRGALPEYETICVEAGQKRRRNSRFIFSVVLFESGFIEQWEADVDPLKVPKHSTRQWTCGTRVAY